jgi:cell division protein FtsB
MSDIQKTSWFKRFFSSRLFLVVSLAVVFLIAFGYARAYYQDYKIKQEIRALEEEVKSLQTKKLESMEILQYVTSQDFVEEKARTELNMKKPGEKVVIINRPEDEGSGVRTVDSDVKPLSNPVKWLYYFLNKQI